LLSLPYSELQFNSYGVDDGAEEPSFLIEYNETEGSGSATGRGGSGGSAGGGGSGTDALLPPGKAQLVIWTAQAGMIDALVSRYVDALSDWEEFVKQRKQEKTMSYRPSPAAKGRKEDARGGGGAGSYFTLSRFLTKRSSRSPERGAESPPEREGDIALNDFRPSGI
jgi:hypothetical protein